MPMNMPDLNIQFPDLSKMFLDGERIKQARQASERNQRILDQQDKSQQLSSQLAPMVAQGDYAGAIQAAGHGGDLQQTMDMQQAGQQQATNQNAKLNMLLKINEYVGPAFDDIAKEKDQAHRQALVSSVIGQISPHMNQIYPGWSDLALKAVGDGDPAKLEVASHLGMKMVDKLKLKQQTYAYTTSPGGEVTPHDVHDPYWQPGQPQGQNQSQQQGQPQPQAQQSQPQGMTNIFDTGQSSPVQAGLSPKAQEVAQEGQVNSKQKQLDAQQAFKQKTNEGAAKILQGDPEAQGTLLTSVNNLADYSKSLDQYSADVKNNPVLDNAMAYKSRAAMGTNTNVSNIESSGWGFVQDGIRAMQAAGIKPTQLLNTETEAQRFKMAITGGGTAKSMKDSFNRFLRAQKLALLAHEETRKAAAKTLGQPYQPLLDINQMPGAKILSKPTGDKPIGAIGTLNGVKVRVIGPNQVEEVQ